jgi:hypothetical protein
MTNKQKCDKLAKILETVAEKMRDPSIGGKVWTAEEPALQTLVAQLSIILKRATEISNDVPPRSLRKISGIRKGRNKEEESVEDDWPDIISD